MDEKITANEWNKRKQCPICKDIAEKNIPLDGELMTGLKGEPLPCLCAVIQKQDCSIMLLLKVRDLPVVEILSHGITFSRFSAQVATGLM